MYNFKTIVIRSKEYSVPADVYDYICEKLDGKQTEEDLPPSPELEFSMVKHLLQAVAAIARELGHGDLSDLLQEDCSRWEREYKKNESR